MNPQDNTTLRYDYSAQRSGARFTAGDVCCNGDCAQGRACPRYQQEPIEEFPPLTGRTALIAAVVFVALVGFFAVVPL